MPFLPHLHDLKLKPFFYYFGSKWRAALAYPSPKHDLIVEPFAGGAGYAIRHANHMVLLNDADPIIYSVWHYLINVKRSELAALPIKLEHVDELAGVCQEAKWLIGFWINHSTTSPRKRASKWMRQGMHKTSFWGDEIRRRLCHQVRFIRHWKIGNQSYSKLLQHNATWFIDPPYQNVCGTHYRYNDINFKHLAGWCQKRIGSVIVCEQQGADWLPFRQFRTLQSLRSRRGVGSDGSSKEVIWTNF